MEKFKRVLQHNLLDFESYFQFCLESFENEGREANQQDG